MTENIKLNAVYNGNQTIIESGFTMLSKYFVPFTYRLVKEKVIKNMSQSLILTIFSYKHTENNPYPSNEELARMLDVNVKSISPALTNLAASGIINIKKSKRKNVYDFSPLFSSLEKFIIEYKSGNTSVSVKQIIKDVLNKVVPGKQKEESNFKWTKEYEGKKEVATKEVEPKVVLPKSIQKAIDEHKINVFGIAAIEDAYSTYGTSLHESIYVKKIEASIGKDNFSKYFAACIETAYTNNEQPVKQQAPKKKTGKKEIVPGWTGKYDLSKEERDSQCKKIKTDTLEDVNKEIERFTYMNNLTPGNSYLTNMLESLYAKKHKFESIEKAE